MLTTNNTGSFVSYDSFISQSHSNIQTMKKERDEKFKKLYTRIYPPRLEKIDDFYDFGSLRATKTMHHHESHNKRVSKLEKYSLQTQLNRLRNDKLLFSNDSKFNTFSGEPIIMFDHREQQVAHPMVCKSDKEAEEYKKPTDWEIKNMEKLSKNFVYDKYADFLYYKTQTTGINPTVIKEKLMKSQQEIKKIQIKNQEMVPQHEMKLIISDAKKKISNMKAQRPKEVREKESLLEENAKLRNMIASLKEKGKALQNDNMALSKKCQVARLEIDNFFVRYDGIRMKLKNLEESTIILNKNRRENVGLGYLKELQDRFSAYESLLVDCREYKELLEKIHLEKSLTRK